MLTNFFCRAILLMVGALLTATAQVNALELRSASYFGFASTDHSSLGHNSAGSLIGLDAGVNVTSAWSLGIKTLASGYQTAKLNFYRLSTGPQLTWQWDERYSVQLAGYYFNESGLDSAKTTRMSGKGAGFLLGWQRHIALSKGLSLGLGAFFSRFWGKAKVEVPSDSTLSVAKPPTESTKTQTHQGNLKGMQMSLLFAF